jgi:hypothetical protein
MNTIGVLIDRDISIQLFAVFAILSYYFDNKCVDYKFYVREDAKPNTMFWDTIFSNISSKVCTYNNNLMVYRMALNYVYEEIPVFPDDTIFDGYFRCPKYFAHNIEKIKSLLGFEEKINNVLAKYPEYSTNKTIVIQQVVNCDLQGHPEFAGHNHHLQLYQVVHKPKYFIEAFKVLLECGVDIYDYDILYLCKETDNKMVDYYNQEINKGLKELTGKDLRYKKVADKIPVWEKLFITTSAKHHIIPNSPFAWFGAYLTTSKDAIVCYPKTWLGPKFDGTIAEDDLYPNSWYKIAGNNTDDLFPDNWLKVDEGYNETDLRPETYYRDIQIVNELQK